MTGKCCRPRITFNSIDSFLKITTLVGERLSNAHSLEREQLSIDHASTRIKHKTPTEYGRGHVCFGYGESRNNRSRCREILLNAFSNFPHADKVNSFTHTRAAPTQIFFRRIFYGFRRKVECFCLINKK